MVSLLSQLLLNPTSYIDQSYISIHGCMFYQISNKLTDGGAIYIASTEKYIITTKSSFSYCSADKTKSYGGAIYIYGQEEAIYLSDNCFLSCSANLNGHSVYCEYSQNKINVEYIMIDRCAPPLHENGDSSISLYGELLIHNVNISRCECNNGGGFCKVTTNSSIRDVTISFCESKLCLYSISAPLKTEKNTIPVVLQNWNIYRNRCNGYLAFYQAISSAHSYCAFVGNNIDTKIQVFDTNSFTFINVQSDQPLDQEYQCWGDNCIYNPVVKTISLASVFYNNCYIEPKSVESMATPPWKILLAIIISVFTVGIGILYLWSCYQNRVQKEYEDSCAELADSSVLI